MPLVCVPQSHKNFYKFWWGEELKIAKAQSVESNNIWKAVGKPRQGLVFEKRNKYRLAYQQLIREEQKREKLSYTNDLHDALLKKDGRTFWNCWRSKFERSAPCSQVEGCVDDDIIANQFSQHFSKSYNYNNKSRADSLFDLYTRARSKYSGTLLSDSHAIDTELISKVISDIHCGKVLWV